MVKKLLICFFTTCFSYPIFAAPLEIIYEEVIDGAENYTHIEPLLNFQNELSGFIYTDSINSKIIYDNFETGEYHTIEIEGGKIFKSVCSITDNLDSTFIYTLDVAWSQDPRIHKIIITENMVFREELLLPINGYHMSELTHADIQYSQHLLQVQLSYLVNSGQPPSYSTDNISRTFFVEDESLSIVDAFAATSVKNGALIDQFSNDHCELTNISSEGYSPYWEYYAYAFSRFNVYDQFGQWIAGVDADFGDVYSFFIDNFAPSTSCEELILYANSVDLLDLQLGKNKFIACYKFENDIPEELWYNDQIDDISFLYKYHLKDLLVGIRDSNKIVMLDYLNGQLFDSTELDHTLRNVLFYEDGNIQETLSLVGLNHDTVFVYKLDIQTSIQEFSNNISDLPSTIELYQNHPNPFNAETRLEFSNEINQQITLKIYNILGQEIQSLASGYFSPGNYTFYWNGKNQNGYIQATGIYFARLESENSSQMIKLIYLK